MNPGRAQIKFAFGQHDHSCIEISQKMSGFDLVAKHDLQFMGPAISLYGVQYFPMEIQYILFRDGHICLQRQLPQDVHHRHDVYAGRALACAGITTHADPDGGTCQDILAQTVLDFAEQGVRSMAHGLVKWADRGAGAALEAGADVYPAENSDFITEGFPPALLVEYVDVTAHFAGCRTQRLQAGRAKLRN